MYWRRRPQADISQQQNSCCCCWSLSYSAILRSRSPWYNRTGWLGVKHKLICLLTYLLRSQEDSLRSHVILREWIAFYISFLMWAVISRLASMTCIPRSLTDQRLTDSLVTRLPGGELSVPPFWRVGGPQNKTLVLSSFSLSVSLQCAVTRQCRLPFGHFVHHFVDYSKPPTLFNLW